MDIEIAQASRRAAVNKKCIECKEFSVKVPEQAHVAGKPHGPLKNIHTDVILKFEVVQEVAIRRIYRIVNISLFLGGLVMMVLTALKLGDVMEKFQAAKIYNWVNMLVAGGDSIVMVVCTACYIERIVTVSRRGFAWSERRWRKTVVNLIQFVAHTLNSLLYFAPNVMSLVGGSELTALSTMQWFGFARYTMWNTIFFTFVLRVKMLNPWVDSKNRCIGREDATTADAPWMHHWPLFLIFTIFQSSMIAAFTALFNASKIDLSILDVENEALRACTVNYEVFIYVGLANATLIGYQIAGLAYIYRGYCLLKEKPYNLFRSVNMGLRYHFLHIRAVGDFILFSMIVLFWVRCNSCATEYLTMLGLLPPHLVMTALSAVNCIMAMPVKPGRTVTLSMQTDNLEWQETSSETTQNELKDPRVDNKFCFELSVKLWYWSLAVYAFDPATQECHDPQYPLLSFPVAMSMFGFQHHEFIAEKGSDTRILMAWNDHTILVCFRGTYSATNVWSDLQFWRVVHPPKRGSYFMRSQPLVHRGFLACWEHSQLNHRIVSLVRGIMDGAKFDRSRLRVLVTGHSLGGALAVLASHELATSCGIGDQITCYTYGAPRVGNHAFVREYNVLVPNTWQVINDVDLIPSVPKFVLLFKHVGERVIINGAGDMIVKPHAVEVSLYRMYGYLKRSIRIMHHLLLSYRASFVAICEAQYKHGKALEGGMEAMEILLKKREKLLSSGLNVDPSKLQDLHRLGSQVWVKKSSLVGKENG